MAYFQGSSDSGPKNIRPNTAAVAASAPTQRRATRKKKNRAQQVQPGTAPRVHDVVATPDRRAMPADERWQERRVPANLARIRYDRPTSFRRAARWRCRDRGTDRPRRAMTDRGPACHAQASATASPTPKPNQAARFAVAASVGSVVAAPPVMMSFRMRAAYPNVVGLSGRPAHDLTTSTRPRIPDSACGSPGARPAQSRSRKRLGQILNAGLVSCGGGGQRDRPLPLFGGAAAMLR